MAGLAVVALYVLFCFVGLISERSRSFTFFVLFLYGGVFLIQWKENEQYNNTVTREDLAHEPG